MDSPRETDHDAFVGAVLTGGRSTRMGEPKALLLIEGVPMATRVARAMQEAGAREVFLVGGDEENLSPLGLRVVADKTPHEGPLAGVIAALEAATEEIVVVTACDMPWVRKEHVARLVGVVNGFDVVVSASEGELQPLHAVWVRSALEKVELAFLSGERSPLRVIRSLEYAIADFGPGSWSVDLDAPSDVASLIPPPD